MPPSLDPPDSFYANCAAGWLELGLPDDAEHELARLSPQARTHPVTLGLGCQLAIARKDWKSCLRHAEGLLAHDSHQPGGWIHLCYALHELGQTQEAWDKLLPAADRFPKVPTIPYNLACYACQLGRTEEALFWLKKAMQLGDARSIRELALQDPDLAAARNQILSLPN